MKRYRIEHTRPGADDPFDEWVPADVAQALYDALEEMVESYGYVDFATNDEREADPDVIAARAALDKARAEEFHV